MTSQLAEKDPEAQMADGSMEGHRPGRGGAGSSVHALQKHEEGHISTYNEQRPQGGLRLLTKK